MSDDSKFGRFYYNPETRTVERVPYRERKEINAPLISVDTGENELNGKRYTNRQYLREMKAMGYVEKGTYSNNKPKRHVDTDESYRADTERAYTMVRDGMAPLTEKEREICKRENQRVGRKP